MKQLSSILRASSLTSWSGCTSISGRMDIGLFATLSIVGIAACGWAYWGRSMNPLRKSGGQHNLRGVSLGKALVLLATAAILLGVLPGCALRETENSQRAAAHITIIHDNNPYDDRLRTAWGFSCVIELAETVILFDTGDDGALLLGNMERLGIDPKEIDLVVLSHIDWDHVGGLASFLERNSKVTVYMPESFSQRLKDEVRLSGAKLKEVDGARELLDGVCTTGELDGGTKEQSLVLRTAQGLVVVTGRAHPGVVNIVRRAKEVGKDKVHLVLGGFYLNGASASTVEAIIEDFVALGVEKVAPWHCSGDRARSLFQEHFGPSYIECGVGREVWIGETEVSYSGLDSAGSETAGQKICLKQSILEGSR